MKFNSKIGYIAHYTHAFNVESLFVMYLLRKPLSVC